MVISRVSLVGSGQLGICYPGIGMQIVGNDVRPGGTPKYPSSHEKLWR
jgi:hypothetical protein